MNRADVHDGDEAWIAKYREALKSTPVETSSFMKLWLTLKNVSGFVISHFRRANGGPQRDLRRSIPARAAPIGLPTRSSARQGKEAELIAKRAIKKPTETTARPKLVKPSSKRRAPRPA
jgi:hypothetical protein